MDIKAVQKKLISLGYGVGSAGADGIIGRSTIAAIAKFQADQKLDIKYHGTIGAKTLAALGLHQDAKLDFVPWVAEAKRYLGIHEIRDAKTLDKLLKLDASEIAWCGSFCGMVVATSLPSEPLPNNPLGSRNWIRFGVEIPTAQEGGIAVFWRGSKDGWQGHVGFCVGHDRTHVHVLGGNQQDKVSIARVAKDRLLGYRWPLNYPPPPKKAMPLSTIDATITTNEA